MAESDWSSGWLLVTDCLSPKEDPSCDMTSDMLSEGAADAVGAAEGGGAGATTAGTLIPFFGLRGLLEVSLLALT